MDGIIKTLFDSFQVFIKRSLMPSMVFFIIFTALWLIIIATYNISIKDDFIFKVFDYLISKGTTLFIIVIAGFMIGYSYLVNFLHQHLFDDFIRENYDYWFLGKKEQNIFKNRREKVFKILKDKFKDDSYLINSDFVLYEILGNKAILGDETSGYVDSARLIGIIYFSIIFSTIILFFKHSQIDSLYLTHTFTILSIILYIPFRFLIKSRYRARNRRLYINYLIKENLKESCDKPNISKNKSLSGTIDIKID